MMGNVNKSDKLDAKGLAKLLHLGSLPTVWLPPGEIRDERELHRTRTPSRCPSGWPYPNSGPPSHRPGPVPAFWAGVSFREEPHPCHPGHTCPGGRCQGVRHRHH
jgi:hypothetical protein